jgi:hypothetical protein
MICAFFFEVVEGPEAGGGDMSKFCLKFEL